MLTKQNAIGTAGAVIMTVWFYANASVALNDFAAGAKSSVTAISSLLKGIQKKDSFIVPGKNSLASLRQPRLG